MYRIFSLNLIYLISFLSSPSEISLNDRNKRDRLLENSKILILVVHEFLFYITFGQIIYNDKLQSLVNLCHLIILILYVVIKINVLSKFKQCNDEDVISECSYVEHGDKL